MRLIFVGLIAFVRLIGMVVAAGFIVGCAKAELPVDDGLSGDVGVTGDADPISDASDVSGDANTTDDAHANDGSIRDTGGADVDLDVESVAVTPSGAQMLQVGQTLELQAIATVAGGDEVVCPARWSSLDPSVARVNASGEVTGQAPGITEVVADCQGASDRLRLYVNDSGLASGLTDPDDLAVWLRSDVGLDFSGGAQIERWEDISSNGIEVASETFSRHPRRIGAALAGHPVVRFSGNQELRANGHLALTQATVFVVAKSADASHRGQLISNCGGGGNNQFRFDGTASRLFFYGEENGLDERLDVPGETTSYQLLTVVLADRKLRVLQNGGGEVQVDVSTSGTWNLGQVGARCSSEYLDGDIAEIMIYDRALSDAEREDVEGYLLGRYRL